VLLFFFKKKRKEKKRKEKVTSKYDEYSSETRNNGAQTTCQPITSIIPYG
jgi:hypothetical protein